MKAEQRESKDFKDGENGMGKGWKRETNGIGREDRIRTCCRANACKVVKVKRANSRLGCEDYGNCYLARLADNWIMKTINSMR